MTKDARDVLHDEYMAGIAARRADKPRYVSLAKKEQDDMWYLGWDAEDEHQKKHGRRHYFSTIMTPDGIVRSAE